MPTLAVMWSVPIFFGLLFVSFGVLSYLTKRSPRLGRVLASGSLLVSLASGVYLWRSADHGLLNNLCGLLLNVGIFTFVCTALELLHKENAKASNPTKGTGMSPVERNSEPE